MEQTPTIEIRFCRMCATAILATHRFCRRCGSTQNQAIEQLTTRRLESSLDSSDPAAFRALSGALVHSLVESVRMVKSPVCKGRFAKKMLSALVPIPILFLIILVAPFDAYLAARQVLERS